MYRKILVPLDGSRLAERVLPHVLELARAHDAEIVLMQVPLYAYAGESAYAKRLIVKEDREEALRESKKYLNKLRSHLIRLGVRVSTVIAEGEAATRIAEYARQTNVDLIAMFSRIQSRWRRALLGNVTDKVMRRAGKPVLVISP